MSLNICLIKPSILHKSSSFALLPTAPLGLAYIAAALKKHNYNIEVIDSSAEGFKQVERFKDDLYLYGLNEEQIIARIRPDVDVICFALMFTNNWLSSRSLINKVREKFPSATLIAGGEHATAAPELCLKQSPLNYIVLGEGEETIVELVQAIQNQVPKEEIGGIAYLLEGQLVRNKARKRIKNVKDIAWPAWELFPIQKYFDNKMSHGVYRGRTLPVMATRGCPYTCTFCSNPQMWGRNYEMRPPEDFIDELEHLNKTYGVSNFDLYDLTAIIFKDWIVAMCQGILDRGLDITYQLPSGTRAEAIDYEVADLLFRSGCKNITYAPESGSKEVLRAVKKKVKIEKMLDSISYSRKAGINVHLNMIIGFPDDTHRNFWQTWWFIVKCSWYGANDMAMAVFTPYPGSELYDRLTKEGKVDIFDDKCIIEIINSYDLWPNKVYCNHMSETMVKVYVFIALITFYGTNYLFRPLRFFKTIRNILQHKHESRLEQILYKNFFRNIFDNVVFQKISKLGNRIANFF
ncbi:MAG: radical SAM protein [Chitinophagales bacterium]|nr:radical SAM protein [Chitinophagales bacterium]